MQEKATKAAKRYLESKDYEVLDEGFGFDIIAKDDDWLVFIDVTVQEGSLPEDRKLDPRHFEAAALDYLRTHDQGNGGIRYDTVSMAVINENQAFLRHHVGALNS